MNIVLLDLNFEAVAIVDMYQSFIWTDRFNEAGDFEFYSKASLENFNLFKQGYYLKMDSSEHLMIIEGIEIISDLDDGNKIRVIGRSLESLLDRRIIWEQTNVTGSIESVIKKLISDAILTPKIAERKIDNFIFQDSTDKRLAEITIEDSQFTGDNLYDVVCKLCQEYKVGFKIVLDEHKNFVFSLYLGTDRTNDQTNVIAVIFSKNFDNIINSSYVSNYITYKNITLVAGEGEGKARKNAIVGDEVSKGIDRRELFTDARDISSNTDNGTIPAATYTKLLKKRGQMELLENDITLEFDGQVDTDGLFRYGVDFFLGDLVHFYDEYGNGSKVRVDEMIFSWDSNGKSAYPSFVILNKNKET